MKQTGQKWSNQYIDSKRYYYTPHHQELEVHGQMRKMPPSEPIKTRQASVSSLLPPIGYSHVASTEMRNHKNPTKLLEDGCYLPPLNGLCKNLGWTGNRNSKKVPEWKLESQKIKMDFSPEKKKLYRVTVLLVTESFWILTLGRTLTRSSISIYSSRLCQSFHQVITIINSDIFYLQTVMFSITDTDINIF